eukprot:TRINITY_DN842_c0_g1_i1.p1 TRINITY_DN842_c0_g1~~TRINITY_DN842_c0_g1_i1.p1  ORF type:complete len:300 (+),score=120.09 TRINITY_DN842_c0_g1_i1:473-1372(+)
MSAPADRVSPSPRPPLALPASAPIHSAPHRLPPRPRAIAAERTFQTSYFKVAYDAAKAPATLDEFLGALQALITKHSRLRGIDPAVAVLFFSDLREAATKERRLEVQNAAARVWTSPKTIEKREMAFILNDALREDNPELMPCVAAFTRAINLLLVSLSRLSMAPASNMVYRGGGLPEPHRAFFTPGKKYRAPMFVATSVDRDLCLKIFCRRAQMNLGHPPVLWVIRMHEREGCKHVNYIHTTECMEEQEYLFSPYSVFTVEQVDWKAAPEWKDPHVVHLRAATDNRLEPETLPLAPWS